MFGTIGVGCHCMDECMGRQSNSGNRSSCGSMAGTGGSDRVTSVESISRISVVEDNSGFSGRSRLRNSDS